MVEHRVVACRLKKSKIAAVCEKMGIDGWTFTGNFVSSFLFIFRRNYLIFVRSGK